MVRKTAKNSKKQVHQITKKTTRHSTGRSNFSKANKILIIIAIVSVIILSVSLVHFIKIKNAPFEVKNLNYDFKVKQAIGLNVDTDILHMGGGPVGSVLERSIDISSPKDALVRIFVDGPGDLTVDKNNFLIRADDKINLTFSMLVPDLPLGNYSGLVVLKFYPVKG